MKDITESFSANDTQELGKQLGLAAKPGDVFALTGDLGVGKTVFAEGFARGLGITEPVTSPTFTILAEYDDGRLPFYHFDVCRIGTIDEMDEIGYEDCFFGEGVSLVEWAEMIEELLPDEYTSVTIEKDLERGFDYRRITVDRIKKDVSLEAKHQL